jgi:hypothetical protein
VLRITFPESLALRCVGFPPPTSEHVSARIKLAIQLTANQHPSPTAMVVRRDTRGVSITMHDFCRQAGMDLPASDDPKMFDCDGVGWDEAHDLCLRR